MKRLLTDLYKCTKCHKTISVYKGTDSAIVKCSKCGSHKNIIRVKEDNI